MQFRTLNVLTRSVISKLSDRPSLPVIHSIYPFNMATILKQKHRKNTVMVSLTKVPFVILQQTKPFLPVLAL